MDYGPRMSAGGSDERTGKKGLILGGGGFMEDGAPRFALAMIDLDRLDDPGAKAELIPLSFLAHGVAIDPNDAGRAAVFEKKGPGACLVDLRARAVLRPIETPPSRRFYGHGAFSADGSLLYSTESLIEEDNAGVLVVRDAQTLKELGTVRTHGAAPHDCQLIDGGRTMVIANGGGAITGGAPPSVSFVDVASERLLDQVVLESPRINAGHVALTPSGDLALVSAPRDGLPAPNQQLGAVTLRPAGGAARTMTEPAEVVGRMRGETLSVVINEADRVVLATHPLGDCVSVWGLDDGACLGTIELSGPRGITLTLDRKWYVISHVAGRSVRLTALSAETREPVGVHVDPSFTSGSHIFAHAL
jgi:hypothetical protein